MGPSSTPQQQWGSPQAAVSPALFPQQQQTQPFGWGNPQAASNVQPGVMPQQPQPSDTADFFRRYFGGRVNGNPMAMQ